MFLVVRAAALALLAGIAITQTAAAQPYPAYPPPDVYAPGYYSRPYYPPPRSSYDTGRLGTRCDAVFWSSYGQRQTVCPLYERRPVGAPCRCPPPPGYPPSRYADGQTIP